MNNQYGVEKITAEFDELHESGKSNINRNNHYRIKVKAENMEDVIETFKKSPLIEYIEPVHQIQVQSQTNDPLTQTAAPRHLDFTDTYKARS